MNEPVPVAVCVSGVVNVIPLLPPQSPDLPVIAEASNDVPSVISWRSTFDQVIVAPLFVIVTAVPRLFALTSSRFVTLFPASVRVPVTVWLRLTCRESVFTAVPVRVSVANVLVWFIVAAAAPVSCTTLYVRPPPLKLAPLPLQIIVDVLALMVMFVEVSQDHAFPEPWHVTVDAPSVNVLTPDPDDENLPHVTVMPFVLSVPAVRVIT